MPFPGIPAGSALEQKIDRCVEDVMKDDPSLSKSSAIGICRASIEGKNMPDEIVEKDGHLEEESSHNPVSGDLPFPMVTSFEELEVVEELSERTGALKRLAKRFQMMMANIISNPVLSPDEKADALGSLSGELQSRVSGTTETREVKRSRDGNWYVFTVDDIDVTSTMPLSDKEALKLVDEVIAKQLKQRLTKREGGVDFPASDFADVPDPEKPSTWKLPLAEDRPGNITVQQVARAITAMQPSGFRGQRVQLGQPKAAVISKISTAIGKTDGTEAQKSNLRRRLNAVKGLRSGFKVVKALDGTPRWLGWVSNNRMDREGEIITEKAHLDYVQWLQKNPALAPELWTWHIPGTARKSRSDFWAYLNGFLILGGPLTEQEAKSFESVDIDPAMSHGFYVLERSDNHINKYRTFEATLLPRAAAANPWTEFTTLKETVMKELTNEQREIAVSLHGEEFVAALEQETADKAALLDELKVQSKEQDEPSETEGESNPEPNATDDKSVIEELSEKIATSVMKQMNPEGLQEAIKSLHESSKQVETAIENINKRLEVLEKSDDEKIAKEFEPGINWGFGHRASESKETVVQENDPLAQQAPQQDTAWIQGFDPRTNGGAQ